MFPCTIVAGHTARAPSQHLFSFQILPGEVLLRRPAYEEVAGPLGELGEIDGIIVRSLLIDVNTGLGAHKADICISGDEGCHDLIRARPVDESQINALLFKISKLNGRVLRGVEDRVGDFI